ncbi:uncharacterized protein F5Z01DRAFT_90249 [Emericellopsis atlantica]|uniref:Uncharacterized protein n=1 Tax=Emericellopsis atlantica TaxID=2614577 RepID=A0A9P7ZN28_9HYPO|nr:uncharacterized protein F5Z01DRAFT_90249 [Emericellopsis atlantica]KAG9254706.1 hypothetical protein F5Z01DRAFT_90249 [Emericellopsis atlantica]
MVRIGGFVFSCPRSRDLMEWILSKRVSLPDFCCRTAAAAPNQRKQSNMYCILKQLRTMHKLQAVITASGVKRMRGCEHTHLHNRWQSRCFFSLSRPAAVDRVRRSDHSVRIDVGGDGASLFQLIPDVSLGSFGDCAFSFLVQPAVTTLLACLLPLEFSWDVMLILEPSQQARRKRKQARRAFASTSGWLHARMQASRPNGVTRANESSKP